MRFEGYKKTDFMNALDTWDKSPKKVKCVCNNVVYEFDIYTDYRKDFKVNGEMILDGKWFVEI